MNSPLVSVVSMSLNSSRYIQETIDSVRSQSYQKIEHIIIDGGSTDGTLEIIKSYKNIICLSERETSDQPAFEASWKGFLLARGEFIIWLCMSDKIHNPDWIKNAVEALESERNASWCWGVSQTISENGCFGKVFESQFLEFQAPQKDDFFYYWLVSGHGVESNAVFRKKVFLRCMPRLGCQDWGNHPTLGLNFNLNSMGYQSITLPIIAYEGRIHDNQLNQTRSKSMHAVSVQYNSIRRKFFQRILLSGNHVFLSPDDLRLHSVKRKDLILKYIKFRIYLRLVKSFKKLTRKLLDEF